MKSKYLDRNEWRNRVSPAFSQYWNAIKRQRVIDPNNKKASTKAFDEVAAASRLLHAEQSTIQEPKYGRLWHEITRPLDGEVWPSSGEPGKGYAVNPEASSFFRDLVFLKFGMTYRELITQMEKDEGAHRKLLRVHQDFYRFRWSGNGFRNLRLKFNLDHFQLLVQGLDFGLDTLNEWELGTCFNEICPCAQRHSGEYLKKLRARAKKYCAQVFESMNKPTSFELP
jgi:hypothetical protein